MKKRLAVLAATVCSLAAFTGTSVAQAHSVSYNIQHGIASLQRIPLSAVLMFGASQGEFTADICANHYIYSGGEQHFSANLEIILQGTYINGGLSSRIGSAQRTGYTCDPSVFGQIVPF